MCAPEVIQLLCQAKARLTVFEVEAVPGETVRPLLLGGICGSLVGGFRLQRFLHRSVARDTVRKARTIFAAGAGRFGLFLAFFVMRTLTPDKAGGLIRPCPTALHGLAGGQFGPDGKYLFCSLLWAHVKVELLEVRFYFGSKWGLF